MKEAFFPLDSGSALDTKEQYHEPDRDCTGPIERD